MLLEAFTQTWQISFSLLKKQTLLRLLASTFFSPKCLEAAGKYLYSSVENNVSWESDLERQPALRSLWLFSSF